MVQETIAIAGADRKSGSLLAQKLVELNEYRLLLLSEDENKLKDLQDIVPLKSGSGTELINCLKDGCWEADIIILDVPIISYTEVSEKIREVSTQKIVFIVSEEEQDARTAEEEWKALLPNAKLVVALNQLNGFGTLLSGTDRESLSTIAKIIQKLGLEPVIKSKH